MTVDPYYDAQDYLGRTYPETYIPWCNGKNQKRQMINVRRVVPRWEGCLQNGGTRFKEQIPYRAGA